MNFTTITVERPLKVIRLGVNRLQKGSGEEFWRSERQKLLGFKLSGFKYFVELFLVLIKQKRDKRLLVFCLFLFFFTARTERH